MKILALLATVLALSSSPPTAAERQATSPLEFVTEYVRQLGVNENLRAAAQEEIKNAAGSRVFSAMIYASTLLQIELRSQIATLKKVRLNPPHHDTAITVAEFYELKLNEHQRLIDISSAIVAGPKPGVDYSALAAEVPKIRAVLDSIDQALFEASPLVFATLIDLKPDSKGKVSRLVITRAERTRLLASLADRFGSKMDQEAQNRIVSTATVLRSYLRKNFRCSDDLLE